MSNLQVLFNEGELLYLQMPDTAFLSTFKFGNQCLQEAFSGSGIANALVSAE